MDHSQSDAAPDAPTPVPNLRLAIRRARIETAQHSEALAEMRGGETARLEILADALKPVLAQVPKDVDLFDAGLTPGEKPRYFIDMLGFVEMARDRRTYRFLQDTRHGRVTVLESDKADEIIEAVTAYIARRLVERQQALVSDQTIEMAARAFAARTAPATGVTPTTEAALPATQTLDGVLSTPVAPAPTQTRRHRSFFATAIMFIVEFLGAIVLCLLLSALVYFLYTTGTHQWALHFAGPYN